MHDQKALEEQGVTGIVVASEMFRSAAEFQSRSLGFDATTVFTAHPIQDRTDAEMQEIADRVIDEIVAKLTGQEWSEG